MSPRSVVRVLLGPRPRALLGLLVPTLLAIAMDLVLRARVLFGFAPQGKAIYLSSWLISAALWGLPLWTVGLAWRRGRLGRIAAGALTLAWLFPLATLGFPGQALYFRVFHAYMGRDTLRLGIALRGTVADWFVAWGTVPVLGGMLALGALVTFAFLVRAGRLAEAAELATSPSWPPLVLALTFPAALACMWFDQLDSRFLQAATPDTCFAHGVVHAARVRLAGQGWIRKGVSLRNPATLPALVPSTKTRPNVLVILTESVRADALSKAPFLDAIVPDRIPLGRLTSQTPNTFSAFLVLATGLTPAADFTSAHAAPVLWELAHAVGYRTAYVSAQNPKYEDFGSFVQRAGIDHLVTGTDLGGLEQEQIGAPDERATDETLSFVQALRAESAVEIPYFAVVHLSNTHAPYRFDPELQPFLPSAAQGLGDIESFHNRYRNSVRMQERTVAAFLEQLRAVPGWQDTVVLFLSDHGEQFREHGGLFHNHSLFEEELRVPGWLYAGSHALSPEQRGALRSYAGKRTYTSDVHATLVDLLGLHEVRGALPLANLVAGRSLLRPWSEGAPGEHGDHEPQALLATSTAVWEPDDARYGVMQGDRVIVSSAAREWVCFDLTTDPGEKKPLVAGQCGALETRAKEAFGGQDGRPRD